MPTADGQRRFARNAGPDSAGRGAGDRERLESGDEDKGGEEQELAVTTSERKWGSPQAAMARRQAQHHRRELDVEFALASNAPKRSDSIFSGILSLVRGHP
jgi:hypothetical protein